MIQTERGKLGWDEWVKENKKKKTKAMGKGKVYSLVAEIL